jgi:hypothetical protein
VERRKKFEEQEKLEKTRREEMLHTHEIRLEHYVKMCQLSRSYDKTSLNDTIMDYEYLH